MAYALTMLRQIPEFRKIVSDGGWKAADYYNEGLLGQKVGLVGFGAGLTYGGMLTRWPFL